MRVQIFEPRWLLEIFLALAVVGLALHVWFLRELKKRHGAVWRRLGEPSLFLNNSIRNGLRTLKFRWSSEATSDLGVRFRRLTLTLRVIDVVYLLVFVAIVWLQSVGRGS